MADLSGVTDKYFTIASETFTDNLSASIAAGAATVPVNNNSEYTNGDDVVLTVDPGTVNEATFIGRKSGLNFINCVWTEGNTAVGHSNGATVIDYDSATHHNAQTKGIQQFANSDGTLKTQPVRDALGLGATAANGWEVAPYTFTTVSGYNKGNREFDIKVAGSDLTGIYSKGQRLRFTRGTTPGTQCADFASASSQYASRASGSVTGTMSTVTDDITVEAWVKFKGLQGTDAAIVSKSDANSGFWFGTNTAGQITLSGSNAAAGNYRRVVSKHTIQSQVWLHCAAALDMSGWTTATNVIWLNGISVPVTLLSAGTNPTAFVNAGPLQLGGLNSGVFSNVYVSDVRIWNILRTSTQIRDNMYNSLVGTETNLIAYFKLQGNFNDSTTAANNLTGSGGAAATTADYPYTITEYAIITKVTYGAPDTTITVISPEGGGIPNQTLTAPYYSAQKTPFGFPTADYKWTITMFSKEDKTQASPVSGTWYNPSAVSGTSFGAFINLPTGDWDIGYEASSGNDYAASGNIRSNITLSPTQSAEGDPELTGGSGAQTVQFSSSWVKREKGVSVTTQTPYYLNTKVTSAGVSVVYILGQLVGMTKVYAKSALI